jgi:hypothetical protein
MNPFIPPRNLPLPQERMTIIPATRGGLDIDAGATSYTPPFVEAEGGPEPEQEPSSPGPFTPTISRDGETDQIACTAGAVVERETQSTVDAPTIVHRVDALPPTAITDGQSLYVDYPVGSRGQITESPSFLIAATDTGGDTARYYPPADGEAAGTAGRFRVPIADFSVTEGVATLTPRANGSNIAHVQDLPTIRETGGAGASVFAGFDQAAGAYLLRHILGLRGISAEVQGDNVEVRAAGSSFNILIRYYFYDFNIDFELESFSMTQDLSTGVGEWAYVRDGLLYLNPVDVPTINGHPDLDDDNIAGAGAKYPRLVIYQPNPALYHGGQTIILVPEP